ncbi:hypothetical protein WDZ16_09035 [Pseudokineococcus marinus]|uniref:Uncharacterized protein n=1 Tax=Pseudokineococcus marinus TaxID=351215 RepID=A0A849BLS6_9ACTN|nr:hypothetical protein [Pseudokineococcus marinus]NNH22273.1 hypothetical protein [Pseudokineococcus marinus]
MSTDLRTARRRYLVVLPVALALVVAVGLLLRDRAPGGMGDGFLVGGGLALVACAAMAWRTTRGPGRATTFERGWTQTGDERDDAVLTRALAVLGLASLPLTGVAGVALGLGARPEVVVTLLLAAEAAVLVAAFVVHDRQG